MIYQQWCYYFIHLTIFPSNQFSSPSNHTLLQSILHFPLILFLLSSSPFLNQMYSLTYVSSILNLVLYVLTTNQNFRKVFTFKTNLLCNPTTKVTIRSPLEVKKNVTFLSHSPKPFINFYYHVFHYSSAIHLPFLYVYIYLSPCILSISPKTTNSSKYSIKQSIYANKIVL